MVSAGAALTPCASTLNSTEQVSESSTPMETYDEAVSWLYARQAFGIKLGLENMRRLSAALGSPHTSLRFLHVAGTNGKGSVCAMADAILQAHGLRCGLFTSPHLVNFTERIRVDGVEIPRHEVVCGLGKIRRIIDSWEEDSLTFFEIVCALALDWFARSSVDIVVWETGMGGRLDATNIVDPSVCIITSIGMDHRQWLGDTLAEIAAEKAGIIKPGVPVIALPQNAGAEAVLRARAELQNAPLRFVDKPFPGALALLGPHQRWNAAASVAACEVLLAQFNRQPDPARLSTALATTSWPGRFQLIDSQIILDGAHNPPASLVLANTLREIFPAEKITMIFGALADKEVDEVLAHLLPLCNEVIFVPVRSPRCLSPRELQKKVPHAKCFEDLSPAITHCRKTGERILITGSLFLVGEALALLQNTCKPVVSEQ